MRTRVGSTSRGLGLVVAVCLGVGVLETYRVATAQPNAGKAAAPTAVAVVDVNKVLEASEEWVVAMGRLKSTSEQRNAELKKIETDVAAMKQKVDAAAKGSPERQRLAGELLEKNAQGEVRVKVFEQMTELEAGQSLWDIYVKINAAVAEVATQQGYDLVLANDSALPEIPEGKQFGAQAVRNTTSDRQILFAGPKADITDQVINVLNNRFNAKAGQR